ncbi:MAG: sugar ABC transporter ATP-binding protein [Treponema sp.]|jgi:ribose transport system ATP-binding protein|nr:sugar ABC transporter ATP-binding protein [Treponema sp.]
MQTTEGHTLEVRNITKIFPGVRALNDVSLKFSRGEIHALMGENGAGKSTLLKIITGIYKPDDGQVCIDGKPLKLHNFEDAVSYDINIVNQEIQLIPESTIAENMMLDRIKRYSRYGIFLNWNRINAEAEKYLDMVGLRLSPLEKVNKLTAAQKQLIQIAKALSSKSKYIFFDEPTSSLTQYEAESLFRLIRKLKEENHGIIFVSHKIEEVLSLCDKISVLRDGKYIRTEDCKNITRQDIVKMMIGREEEIDNFGTFDRNDDVVLRVEHLSRREFFDDISFELHRGEILGFYGLIGAGRTELARAIVGADRHDSGKIYVNGCLAEIRNMQDALNKYGVGYVSENRKEEGLILPFSVSDNITMPSLKQYRGAGGLLDLKKLSDASKGYIENLRIKTPGLATAVETLSGGNQQKVSIGKWLAAGCDILIIDEPTVGVDVGAKRNIHNVIWDLAKRQGKSVILISSDMPEIISLAHRIIVMKDYKIMGEMLLFNRDKTYEEISYEIGSLIV